MGPRIVPLNGALNPSIGGLREGVREKQVGKHIAELEAFVRRLEEPLASWKEETNGPRKH